MWSSDDLVDILAEALATRRPARPVPGGEDVQRGATPRVGKWGFHVRTPFNAPWTSLPVKRPFVSEQAARRLVAKGETGVIRIPGKAILSPLAEDWLAFRGIRVVRESE